MLTYHNIDESTPGVHDGALGVVDLEPASDKWGPDSHIIVGQIILVAANLNLEGVHFFIKKICRFAKTFFFSCESNLVLSHQ